ncbi:3D domain-containing protein [Clostridium cellulovorans]|uniref:3D domain-containing protein n=1 Tax=Clostridium cellulovorans (strain ATCC 35296 / DSM 3052 / OCM 3 / 743B) TaxID=573061 RepID=D9SPQ5_CLOC7|nr:3D domain-containing protein [Clostridium cellulovorans]ADL50104.1 3D domain-containing protein [Clostridium cellulovorans 743B]
MSKSVKAIAALCVTAMLFSTNVQAVQSSEDVQNQINSQQAELNDLKKEKDQLLGQIDQYADEIADTMATIDANNKKMDQIQTDIDKAIADIETAEKDEKEAREKYYERLRLMYKNNNNMIIEILFSSSSLGDLLEKVKVIQKIGQSTEGILEQLKDKQANTKQRQDELVLENEKLEDTKKQNETYLSEVQAKMDKANGLSKQLQEKEGQKAKEIESSKATLDDIKKKEAEAKLQDFENSESPQGGNTVSEGGAGVLTPGPSPTIEQPNLVESGVTSRGTNDVSYSRKYTMISTAYTAGNPGVGSRTASGLPVSRNPGGYSTVAVDPSVIPLGTKLYISGYGYAIAADTGSAIKSKKIDVYFNTLKECYSWGVRYVEVYVLE